MTARLLPKTGDRPCRLPLAPIVLTPSATWSNCLDRVQPKDAQFVNACLTGLDELKPRDHTERLLITQMMAVHHRALESLAEGNRKPFDRERLEKHAVRLMRLFAQQAETLKRYRRDATQVVNVNHMVVDKALIGCDIPQQGGLQN